MILLSVWRRSHRHGKCAKIAGQQFLFPKQFFAGYVPSLLPVIVISFDIFRKLGLQSLAKLVLDVELDKSSSVRCSDWETDVLTPQQVSVVLVIY